MSGRRVLIVDDEKNLVRILKMNLEDKGYKVETAFDGIEALKKIKEVHPELVILDVMMPKIDGWEVLAGMRKDPQDKYIPVIMLTSKTTDISKVFGFDLGADDYVTKPFDIDELVARVGAILRRFPSMGKDSKEKQWSKIPAIDSFKGIKMIDQQEIIYIDAIHNYTYLHCYDEKYLSRLTLFELEEKLVDIFMRIHRSNIVNLRKIESVFVTDSSSYRVRLDDKVRTELPVSRRKIRQLKSCLGVKS